MEAHSKARDQIKLFSDSLTKIHRILIDDEFAKLEETQGKLSPVARLQMLLHGPELAWLRPLSQLMAKVDEVLFQKEPIEEKHLTLVLHELRAFFILESEKLFSDNLGKRTAASSALNHELIKLKTQIIS